MPILVVDDFNTMSRIIRNLLKQLGFNDVDEASDGTAALSKVRQRNYGLVISDWNMRSEEHTSELQSLMRISYAVFCLKKKKKNNKEIYKLSIELRHKCQ